MFQMYKFYFYVNNTIMNVVYAKQHSNPPLIVLKSTILSYHFYLEIGYEKLSPKLYYKK